MTRTMKWQGFPIALTLFLAGCGGCQPGEEGAEPGAARPAAQAPTVAAPAAKPPAAEAPAAQPQQLEADCFVLVDAEPDYGKPPLKVEFSTEIECTGSPVTYSWDFGDGTTGGNEQNATHVYQKVGEYVAVVKATAPDGGEGEDEIDISVDEEAE